MPVILAVWEAEQKDHKFKLHLGNLVRCHLKIMQ